MIIAFEGIDGSGKTTLMNRLQKYFNGNGGNIKRMSPGNLDIGAYVYEMSPDNLDIGAYVYERVNAMNYCSTTKLLANLAALNEISEYVDSLQLKETSVFFDRYYFSTYAYNTTKENISIFEEAIKHMVKPDLTIILYIDYETYCKRLNERGEVPLSEKEFNSIQQKYHNASDYVFSEHKIYEVTSNNPDSVFETVKAELEIFLTQKTYLVKDVF